MRMRIKQLADGTNEVDIKLLPDGRSLIHWLRECDDGLIYIEGHPKLREVMGRPPVGHYTLACRPEQNTISSQKRGSVRLLCMTSGELAAVTCSKCLATIEARETLAMPADSSKVAQLVTDSIGV